MNILVIGNGGREHALVHALSRSKSCEKLYCAPGNPGIFNVSEKADIDINNFQEIVEFCKSNNIDLVVPGPEQPLADGIADYLDQENIPVFGPSKNAALLESSKAYAKEFMEKHNIPTAAYKIFSIEEADKAYDYLDGQLYPIVLKSDGLAGGKGVIIVDNKEVAHDALSELFKGKFGSASKTVVIEEFMQGEEGSVLAVCDGVNYVILAPSQDHKKVLEGEKGKNTGGMGAYAPAPVLNDDLLKKVEKDIIEPTLKGLDREGFPFKGCLYAGVMIHDNKPKVVEYNVRFGDPETQSVLSIFEGDFAELLYSAAKGKINKNAVVNVASGFACNVVLASAGYPDDYEKGFEIFGLDEAEKAGAFVYHAGTKMHDNKIITSGGRVLAVNAKGSTLKEAVYNAYKAVEKIDFKNKYYRKDIGFKGLEREGKKNL